MTSNNAASGSHLESELPPPCRAALDAPDGAATPTSRGAGGTRSAGWWADAVHHPRRLWLRGILLQVHLWSGLVVGLLATIAGLSGSALVYREALDRMLAPSLYRVSAAPPLGADELLARVERALPASSTVQSLDVGARSAPWTFHLLLPGGRAAAAYVDAGAGRLLGLRGEREGAMNWLYALHTELFAGKAGTLVAGAGAVGLFLLCLTGTVLWWPGRGRVRRAAAIRFSGSRRRLNWDIHVAGGFWISLPLAVQAFSGIFLCFGLGALLVLLGGRASEFNDLAAAPDLRTACPAPHRTLQAILDRARALHPGADDAFLLFPPAPSKGLTIFSRTSGDLRSGRVTILGFDPCSGALLKHADSRRASPALRAVLLLDAFHFGLIGGNVARPAWILLGLCPGTLFVTGFLLWRRRIATQARERSRSAVSAPQLVGAGPRG